MRGVDTIVFAGVGAALAGAGALLLGRRPRGIAEWNEAFLAGAALASALIFAASLLLGPFALLSLATVFAAAGLSGLFVALRRPAAPAAPPPGDGPPGLADVLLGGWIALAFLAFAAANLRYHLLWDGLHIWATKAMLLVDAGRLTPELWVAPDLEGRVGRVVSYPPLVPLLEALAATVRGAFDFDAVKPLFLLFFASLLAGTFEAGRRLAGRRGGLAATALVAALPPLSTSWAAGGYADMPQAAALVALAGALLRGDGEGPAWRRPAPWLLGAVVSVKGEGTILAAVALGGWAAASLFASGPRGLAAAARREAGGLAVAAAFLLQRLAYLRWAATPWDLNYRPLNAETLVAALGRLPEVARLVVAEMTRVPKWGLLWPAFAAAAAFLLVRGDPKTRALAASGVLGGALYSSTFLFTNWPIAVHVQTALDRILAQLAPVAVLVVLAALLPGAGTPAARREEEKPTAPPPGR